MSPVRFLVAPHKFLTQVFNSWFQFEIESFFMPISRLSLASELLLYQSHSALPDKTLPIIAPLRRFLRPGLNSPLLIFNYWRRRPARLHVCTPFSVLLSRKKSLHLTMKKASPHEKKGLRSREKNLSLWICALWIEAFEQKYAPASAANGLFSAVRMSSARPA